MYSALNPMERNFAPEKICPSVAKGNPGFSQLPAQLRRSGEHFSGFDLSAVRVKYNSPFPAKFGAKALARGAEIHLGPGAESSLPHELWHVVQQLQGRVKATRFQNGLPVNDDPCLEAEADLMGWLMMQPLAEEDQPRALEKARFWEGVLQFDIKVGNENKTLNALYDLLKKEHDLPNTPILDILKKIENTEKEYTDFKALNRDARRFDLGMAHVKEMKYQLEIAKNSKDDWEHDYSSFHNRKVKEVNEQKAQLKKEKSKKNVPILTRKSTRTILLEEKPQTWLEYGKAFRFHIRATTEYPFFQWLMRDMEIPFALNCWEAVLYTAWRSGVVSREWIFWALSNGNTLASDGGPQMTFVEEIKKNALYYADPSSKGSLPEGNDPKKYLNLPPVPTPEHIPPGCVIIFGDSAHVALTTGEVHNIDSENARKIYDKTLGAKIIELDSPLKSFVRFSTIEDVLMTSNSYRSNYYYGWFPDSPSTTIKQKINGFRLEYDAKEFRAIKKGKVYDINVPVVESNIYNDPD
ncbi:MAG: DUF4157 domain-containing protein [Bacteroidia bacterium]|nr:DUF4157 domain-containing protein [Bacteroidia bacterium]